MGKRRKHASVTGIWKGMAAECAALLLLTGALAALLQKGTVGTRELMAGLVLICLVAGSAGVLWGPKGEGGAGKRLLACGIPAAARLLAGCLFPGSGEWAPSAALHALCLLLPCLVSLALDRRRRVRGAAGRRRRGMTPARR